MVCFASMKFLIAILLSFASFAYGENLTKCRAQIKKAICVVNPVDQENPFVSAYQRPCLEAPAKYTKLFQSHFDRSIPAIQCMYCSLEKIWIENELATTGYATPITDMQDNLVAAGVGFSRKFLDANLSLADWLSQKEEMSFGKVKNLIRYHVAAKKKLSATDYAINHEFGHLFDYANKISNSNSAPFLDDENRSEFLQKFSLCFYQCGGEFIDKNQAGPLFHELLNSNFQSTYATQSAKEDWAEVFALFVAIKYFGLTLQVQVGNEKFDLIKHFNSEKLQIKKQFVESFMSSDIHYPSI